MSTDADIVLTKGGNDVCVWACLKRASLVERAMDSLRWKEVTSTGQQKVSRSRPRILHEEARPYVFKGNFFGKASVLGHHTS